MAPGRQAGVAIILAMLLSALAAAVAVTVFADQRRWAESVLHRRDQVQAQAVALAGIQWARQILHDDARRGAIDHLGEPWAVPLPAIPLENGSIRGAIVDAQSRLNVNALGATGATAGVERVRLQRLFAQRGGPVTALDAIADWIDADTIPRSRGAEDAYYLAQPTPALAADAPILRGTELLVVRGVTEGSLSAVAAFVAALPADTPVNVNTAPVEVLAAVVDGAGPDALAGLVTSRANKPFTTVAEFRARLPSGASLASELGLAVRSDYFYATVEARQGTTLGRARALLRRRAGAWPTVVWQVVE
ncbi:MAG: type II secretion system minor pseudopilin GspK [Betaproteobacteria bacterium]|nr:type II secretion system minor pseudopilin GspK [Betaproteobacteria bacterium]